MILEGRILAQQIRAPLAQRAAAVRQKIGRPISLAAIGSADDYGAYVYLKKEVAAADKMGLTTKLFEVTPQTPAQEFITLVQTLSADTNTDAILIPRPLPLHLAATNYAAHLAAQKDVDGMSNINMGNLFLCKTWQEINTLPGFVPCTAMAVIKLLEFYRMDLTGKEVAVIGRSSTVGRPLAHLLTCKNATVKICHRQTDLPRAVQDADIICSAAGSVGLVQAQWLKPGATVIDISTNWHNNQLTGDADPSALQARGINYSPVPGGVGPVTLAVLLENMVLSKERTL